MSFHQGDIVWLDFDPQAGHEEGKRRPALILSGNTALSLIKPLAIVCPITSRMREFPTHVPFDSRTKTRGMILCEQVKSMDLDARNAALIEQAPSDIVKESLDIVRCQLD